MAHGGALPGPSAKSKAARFCAALGVIALLTFTSVVRAGAESTGEIIGHVTDASTGRGVAGASVTALSTTGTYRTLTNRNGYFAIIGAFPNTYVVSVSAIDYPTLRAPAGSVNADQATIVDLKIDKSQVSLSNPSPSNALSVFKPSVVPEQFVLTAAAADATNGSGGSYGLYQVPGIVGTLPGVTLDSGVNAHIRGSRLDEVGYEYDGVSAVDPLTGLAATNLVQDGFVRLEIAEDATDASAASGIAGTVNSVVNVGSYPAHGSVTALIQSPTFYHGVNFEYGSATPDRRFSWFASGVLWNSGYDWGERGTFVPGAQSSETALGDATLGDASPSRDQVMNLHYRPGGLIDDVQLLASTGFERFDNALRPQFWPSDNPLYGGATGSIPVNGLCPGDRLALFPGQVNCTASVGDATDHVDQIYSLDKVQLTHDFGSSAMLAMTYARVNSALDVSVPFGDAPFADEWQMRRSDQSELGADYQAQLDSANLLKTGVEEDRSVNSMLTMLVSSGIGIATPTDNLDRTLWVSDEFRPSGRLTLDLSARSLSRTYYRMTAPAFGDAGTQGDAGLSYAFDALTALRVSTGSDVELPFVSRVERIVTRAPDFSDLSPVNRSQVLDGDPEAARVHAIDVSVERTLPGSMVLKVTPFWNTSSNLTVTVGDQFTLPQSVGQYDVNGIDAELQFLHAAEGISGYVDFTHTRALAGATGDFSQSLSAGALAAHALFPVSFIAPDVANVVLTWHHERWAVNPELNYSSGYPYGVGRFTYNNLNCADSVPDSIGDPTEPCGAIIRNPMAYLDRSGGNCGPGVCRQPIDPGESAFADGRVCCSALTANLNASYEISARTVIGLQWQNLSRTNDALALTPNPYYPSSAYGRPGFNGFVDYGLAPYLPATLNTSEEYLFSITEKI